MSANDGRQVIYQRLMGSVPPTERGRFGRTLAALEAHHKNEVQTQLRIAAEADHKCKSMEADAGVLQHVAAAAEAKLACSVEAGRSELASVERALAESRTEATRLRRLLAAAEARALVSESVLGGELRSVESEQIECAALLRELTLANDAKAQHLGALEQQAARSTALLGTMQDQAGGMQRRLAAQQRRTMRLQESQSLVDAAARSWAQERRALLAAAAQSDALAREAASRAAYFEELQASMLAEASKDREASSSALRHSREMHAAESATLRGELRDLKGLVDALYADGSRVHLRSGGAVTVAQYVRTLGERLQRQRRGGGGAALGEKASAGGGGGDSDRVEEKGSC